jgi:hypothetical protein
MVALSTTSGLKLSVTSSPAIATDFTALPLIDAGKPALALFAGQTPSE